MQARLNSGINAEMSNGRDNNIYPLPLGKFSIIYADPPWDYGGKWQYSRPVIKNDKTALVTSAANWKYPTMKIAALKSLPVNTIAEDDSLLFLWVSSPMLERGIELGSSWGFKYSTVAFVWDKQLHNPGRYTLSQCELCLLFKRGKIPSPRGAKNIKQYISIRRSEHSEKPLQVRKNITKMFPSHRKIELFSRPTTADFYGFKHEDHDNWVLWGNDLPYEIIRQPNIFNDVYNQGKKR